jgi:type I restriction enzyme S subunit
MSLQTFFDNFALLVDAPNGVQKLRELILQLAVQGQLGTQNPNQSATALLRKMALHKERLIKDKQIRSAKLLPPIQSDEIFFDIPATWQWIRLGQVGVWGAGATPNRGRHEYYGGNYRWFKSGELNDGYVRESEETITDLALKECSLRLNQPGDVLIAMYGATIGKLAILETEATTNQAVCACTCFDGFYNQFLFVLLRAYKSHFTGRGAGGAQPNISREKIIHTVAPLPPLEEQKRIVAKVDELMRLCDELETGQQVRRESCVRLNNATLAPLNNAASLAPQEFEQASLRLADNFAALYDSAETVGTLRSTILHLAVQGKLVPQDRNDERGEGLLKRLAEQRPSKIEGGSSNVPRLLEPIEDEEKPFRLPSSWRWARLGDIVSIKHGFAFSSEWFTSEATPFVLTTPGNFYEKGGFRDRGLKTKYYKGPIDPEFIFNAGDLIIPMTEQAPGLLGSPAFIPDDGQAYVHNQRLGKLVFYSEAIATEFVFWFFNCAFFRSELAKTCTGMKVRHTSPKKILRVPFPVCSLAEQRRIVAKVEQLMALVDELETKLRQAETDSEKLMNAAVQHVLASLSQPSKPAHARVSA